jgi:hypothetical protein
VTPELKRRLDSLQDEGWALFDRFDREVRNHRWHPFVAADYHRVLDTLATLRTPGARFLEWGSATGVITVMADLLGFDACGIELDGELVAVSRDLARRYDSGARFAEGSFLPAGYRWRPKGGDGRSGTIGEGTSGYLVLGRPLDDFDLVFGFPWDGEEPMMLDLMRAYGRPGALLLIHNGSGETRAFRDGRRVEV